MGGESKQESVGCRLRFGAFEFDTAVEELYYRGQRVYAQEMPLKVLAILLERPGELIRREEFFARLWPDDTLGLLDGNLNMAVYKLRQALDDAAEHPNYIETVPRRGYRFLATVVEVPPPGSSGKTGYAPIPGTSGDAAAAKSRTRAPATPYTDPRIIAGLAVVAVFLALAAWFRSSPLAPDSNAVSRLEPGPRSIAVLPFTDMSPAGDQAHLAEGLAEDILNLLARNGDLRVSARTSSFSFKGKDATIPEIGAALGVAHVLEGSVQRAGERLRITAQLIETGTGFHLWSDSFDRPMEDAFVIQDEIAAAIAGALEVSIAGRSTPRPPHPEAYDLYLQAERLFGARDAIYGSIDDSMEQARGLLGRALALDPEFPRALALAGVLKRLGSPGDIAQVEAQALLERALELDPQLAEAHAGLGLLALHRRGFDAAIRHLERALEINPSHHDANHWYALTLLNLGRPRDALEARQRFGRVDPLSVQNRYWLAVLLADAGDDDDALAMARELQEEAEDRASGYRAEAHALLRRCRLAEAAPLVERVREMDGAPAMDLMEALYRQLGAFEHAEPYGGFFAVVAPILRGESNQGLDRAWRWVAVVPEAANAQLFLLEGLVLAGQHEELVKWVRQRWGRVESFRAFFSRFRPGWAYVALAGAQWGTAGQEEALRVTLGHLRSYIESLQSQGFEGAWVDALELHLHALAGDRHSMLASLESAVDKRYCDPLLPAWPWLEPWRDDPEFERQFSRMIATINAERSMLGIEPLL
jgi:TolB-like protein/DNA-binding winged helix-turn-helix (wHTH) protein/tetratricopeptide (TPR) repeat protein